MTRGKVLILMGSRSDAEVMGEAERILAEFGVPFETAVSSAHRSPERTRDFARKAERRGFSLIIAGAGAAAHLAGCVAGETILPVIGVPLAGSPLLGFDALLSTVQMPAGVPVATMAVGKAGAQNAAWLAVQVLALSDRGLREKIRARRRRMAAAAGKDKPRK